LPVSGHRRQNDLNRIFGSGAAQQWSTDGTGEVTVFQVKNGEPAPSISLVDTHGEPWSLADRLGKMVILHFGRGEY